MPAGVSDIDCPATWQVAQPRPFVPSGRLKSSAGSLSGPARRTVIAAPAESSLATESNVAPPVPEPQPPPIAAGPTIPPPEGDPPLPLVTPALPPVLDGAPPVLRGGLAPPVPDVGAACPPVMAPPVVDGAAAMAGGESGGVVY